MSENAASWELGRRANIQHLIDGLKPFTGFFGDGKKIRAVVNALEKIKIKFKEIYVPPTAAENPIQQYVPALPYVAQEEEEEKTPNYGDTNQRYDQLLTIQNAPAGESPYMVSAPPAQLMLRNGNDTIMETPFIEGRKSLAQPHKQPHKKALDDSVLRFDDTAITQMRREKGVYNEIPTFSELHSVAAKKTVVDMQRLDLESPITGYLESHLRKTQPLLENKALETPTDFQARLNRSRNTWREQAAEGQAQQVVRAPVSRRSQRDGSTSRTIVLC